MKKWGRGLLLLTVFFAFTSTIVNAETIVVDGTALMSVETVNVNSRVLAPFRAILQYLGAKVDWDKPTKTVTATKGDRVIKMVIGDTNATVNGKNITLDVPPQIIDNFTYIPVRFIGESLDMKVSYVKSSKSVYIDFKEIQVNERLLNVSSTLRDEDISIVKNDEYCTFVGPDGEEAIIGMYEDAKPFVNGVARVKSNDSWGCINKDGYPLVDTQYSALGIYSEKLISYMNVDGTFGFIDSRGHVIIPAQYDYATHFKDGRALVMNIVNEGFIMVPTETDEYMTTALEQAREEIEQEEIYYTSDDTEMQEAEKEQRINTRASELQNQYQQEMYYKTLAENPAYKLQDATNERWMYIGTDGKIIQDNVVLTVSQREALMNEYK